MLIGVTGKSGDGKTTFSRILANNLLNAKIIEVDELHLLSILSQKDKLIELFGKDIIQDGKLNIKLYMKYMEKVRIIQNLINDLLIGNILSKLNALEGNQFVVIEWLRLPAIEKLWNMCDIHILVKSIDLYARYDNLLKRHSNPNLNNLEVPFDITMDELNLRDYYSPDYNRFSYDYVVINNYDIDLFTKGKQIADELQNLK